jgi:O-antigen ligase
MRRLIDAIVPFIILGVIIVVLIAGFVLLSYLLIVGAVVGLILFAITWIREKFFRPPSQTRKTGRTIEHDDNGSRPL